MDSSLHDAYYAIVLGSMIVAMLVPLLLLTRRSRTRIERIVGAEWIPVQQPDPPVLIERQAEVGVMTPATSPSLLRPPHVPGAV